MRVERRSIEHADAIADAYVNISLPEAAHWHAPTIDERASEYQHGVHARLERGRSVRAVDYLAARAMRDVLRDEVDAALDRVHALVLPTVPIVAPTLGATDVDVSTESGTVERLPVRAALLRLTQLFNISGHPAITLPIPTTGLPIGLQLVGRSDKIEELFAVAAACERALT